MSAEECWVSRLGGRQKTCCSPILLVGLADNACAAQHVSCAVLLSQAASVCLPAHTEGRCLLLEGVQQHSVHAAGLGPVYDVSFLYLILNQTGKWTLPRFSLEAVFLCVYGKTCKRH